MGRVYSVSSNGTRDAGVATPSLQTRLSKTRTGYNSGKGPYTVPTDASLYKNMWRVERGWSAMAHYVGTNQSLKKSYKYGANCGWSLSYTAWNGSIDTQANFDLAFNAMLNKQRATIESLVTIGELGETMDMVYKAFDALRKSFTYGVSNYMASLKRFNSRDLSNDRITKAFLKDASAIWLETVFGILPAVAECDSALQALANYATGGKIRSEYNSAKWTTVEREVKNVISTNVSGFQCEIRHVFDLSRTDKCGYTFSREQVLQRVSLQEDLGLELRNFVPSVYELIPYSWLVDYVTNMYMFVNALSFHRGIAENGWKVAIAKNNLSVTCTPVKYNDVAYKIDTRSIDPGIYERTNFQFTRSAFNVDQYVPEFRFTFPLQSQLNNIYALVVQKGANFWRT